ncbi:MAG: exonuclease domain-containing protein [Bacteroidota bacterium]
MYAIIDIETNGGSLRNAKITEIAIFLHDGNAVVDSFISLVNPEVNIPPFITNLTGITNDMVAGAPKFYEIAKKVVELTENSIFVAHSVSFDYSIVRSEFRSLGFDFAREKLCTVKLSRKILPLQPSYSLGNLCKSLNIKINGRHRAGGDAEATVKLFEILLALDNKKITFGTLSRDNHTFDNPNVSAELIESMPEEIGVYYFYNSDGQLIYIGKSKNIRKRVLSHLLNAKTPKALSMRQDIADISYELTGSELVALLKESNEIKQKKPLYNSAQKRTYFQYGLFTDQQIDGYIRLELRRIKDGSLPLTTYASRKEGIDHLYYLNDQFQLCLSLTGLNKRKGACFHHSLKKCNGACIGKELHEDYNARVMEALETFRYKNDNTLIIDRGRKIDEKAVIQVKNGKYVGYGYANLATTVGEMEKLMECVESYQNNRDVQQIINNFLKNDKIEKVIEY